MIESAMKKKLWKSASLLLAAMLTFTAMSACGKQDTADATEVTESAEAETTETETETEDPDLAQSIADSIAESQSIEESAAESLEASLAESESASVEASIAESQSIEESVAASLHESEVASIAEAQSIEASIAESAAIQQSVDASVAESAAAAAEAAALSSDGTTTVCFIGDSRTSDFYWYGFMPGRDGTYYGSKYVADGSMDNNRVYYLGGCCIYIMDQVQEAAARHPSKVLFMCGENDLGYFNGDASLFIPEYENLIATFQSISPETTIYVNRIIPANDYGISVVPARAHTEDYNAAIATMCANHGWNYIDTSSGFSAAYYNADGEHFAYVWYPIWFSNIRAAMGF